MVIGIGVGIYKSRLFPRGKSGLKYRGFMVLPLTEQASLPAREEWIEIPKMMWVDYKRTGSLPAREEWIEILFRGKV